MTLEVPEPSTLDIGDWFRKSRGERLDAFAALVFPHAGGTFAAGGKLSIGACNVSIAQAPVRYALRRRPQPTPGTRPDFDLDADAELPLHITQVEKIAAFCPRWRELLPPDLQMAGNVELASHLRFSRREKAWTLATSLERQVRRACPPLSPPAEQAGGSASRGPARSPDPCRVGPPRAVRLVRAAYSPGAHLGAARVRRPRIAGPQR